MNTELKCMGIAFFWLFLATLTNEFDHTVPTLCFSGLTALYVKQGLDA